MVDQVVTALGTGLTTRGREFGTFDSSDCFVGLIPVKGGLQPQ